MISSGISQQIRLNENISLLTTIEHLITVFLFLFSWETRAASISSAPSKRVKGNTKLSKRQWSTRSGGSAGTGRCLFPVTTEKEAVESEAKGNLRNISSGHVWKRFFHRHLSRGNRRFPGTRTPRATFGDGHYRVDALRRSVSDLSPGWRVWKPRWIVPKRFWTDGRQDATSRLARQSGVKYQARNRWHTRFLFFFFPTFTRI